MCTQTPDIINNQSRRAISKPVKGHQCPLCHHSILPHHECIYGESHKLSFAFPVMGLGWQISLTRTHSNWGHEILLLSMLTLGSDSFLLKILKSFYCSFYQILNSNLTTGQNYEYDMYHKFIKFKLKMVCVCGCVQFVCFLKKWAIAKLTLGLRTHHVL